MERIKRILLSKWMHLFVLSCVLVSMASFVFHDNLFVKKIQNISFDTLNRVFPREATNQVVVVDIDEESLELLGQWPWPRHVMGDIIGHLKTLGAKTVSFDVVFAEADRTSPALMLNNLADTMVSEDLKQELEALPSNDIIFGQDIKGAGNVITAFTAAQQDQTRRQPKLARPIRTKRSEQFIVDQLKERAYRLPGAATNLPEISKYSVGSGAFVATPDQDGIIRQIPLLLSMEYEEERTIYPALSLETMRVSSHPKDFLALGLQNGASLSKQRAQKEVSWQDQIIALFAPSYFVKIGTSSRFVPLSEDAKFWVHYKPKDPKEYVSAYRVYHERFHDLVRSDIEGKHVFIASSSEGLKDIRSTPLNVFVPGVEVHLNVLEQILQERYLLRPDAVRGVEVLYILVLGGLMILLAPFLNSALLGAICLITIPFTAFCSYYSYLHLGILLDPLYPSLSVLILYFASVVFSYMRSESDKRAVRDAFGLYISPSFMEELTKNPEKLTLGGEMRDLSVLFSDIRNFTTISESMSPQALINTMNDFLTPMSDVVMNNRGTIDKYMGDAMMAFWNAPLDDERHAYNACISALKMRDVLEPVNEALKKEAEEQERPFFKLQAGIGINSGPCAVGNMGSRSRFAYSALGDAVNLASRLEGQTKAYGIDILCGEATFEQAPDLAWLEADVIRVKGKEKPVRVYVLCGDENTAIQETFAVLKAQHDAFLKHYRAQEFDAALTVLQQCKAADDQNIMQGYYDIFEQRIQEFQKKSPPQDWDGVFVATSK